MDYRIVSIGALSSNEFWASPGEHTPHATTTLIRSGKQVIVVDPGLPPQVITARLKERSGLDAAAVTHVFLTNFRPAHRRGLAAFEKAVWWIAEAEREAVGQYLVGQLRQETDEGVREVLQTEIQVLKRCHAAPDSLAPHVDLFPLPGYTPGSCGLILAQHNSTTLIAGDAVATAEHLEHGQVLRGAFDLDKGRESFAEAIEIADIIIPGHDNMLLNPTRRPL